MIGVVVGAGILALSLIWYLRVYPASIGDRNVVGTVAKAVATRRDTTRPFESGSNLKSVSSVPAKSVAGDQLTRQCLSDSVRQVIGQVPDKQNYRQRVQALQQLSHEPLAPNDAAGLLAFLKDRYDEKSGLSLLEWNGIKNDVLDMLLKQPVLRDGLGEQLVKIYRDSKQDEVWRNYCVQYFAAYYDRQRAVGGSNPECQAILSAYWDAMREKDKCIAGTALMGLERLSRKYPEIDRGRVSATALALAGDAASGEATRMTALRVCALMNLSEVLPAARSVAQTGATVPLRLAAIATLGDLGTPDDIALLKSLSGSSDLRVSSISAKNLQKLQSRG